MTPEQQETLTNLKYYLTGVKNHDSSMAPLLGNPHQWWYGREVKLKVDQDYTIGLAACCADWTSVWDLKWRPTWINLGDDSIWVYIHQNYWESTPESIDNVVLEWARKLMEELDGEL